MSGEKQAGDKKQLVLRIINIALSVILALLICFVVVKVFFITWAKVDQTSMYPTYEDGQTVFINRLGKAERGTVAVFYDSDVAVPRISSAFGMFSGDAKLLIKRTVALEGDKLWLTENSDGDGYRIMIYAEGSEAAVTEEYTGPDGNAVQLDPITYETAGVLRGTSRFNPYIVGEGCAFMIGDNRDESQDSRVFGDVPVSRIIGTVI